MRELTITETESVSGGGYEWDGAPAPKPDGHEWDGDPEDKPDSHEWD
jgi:hypothetical protein